MCWRVPRRCSDSLGGTVSFLGRLRGFGLLLSERGGRWAGGADLAIVYGAC